MVSLFRFLENLSKCLNNSCFRLSHILFEFVSTLVRITCVRQNVVEPALWTRQFGVILSMTSLDVYVFQFFSAAPNRVINEP